MISQKVRVNSSGMQVGKVKAKATNSHGAQVGRAKARIRAKTKVRSVRRVLATSATKQATLPRIVGATPKAKAKLIRFKVSRLASQTMRAKGKHSSPTTFHRAAARLLKPCAACRFSICLQVSQCCCKRMAVFEQCHSWSRRRFQNHRTQPKVRFRLPEVPKVRYR